jgi:catechol 2,3-dioxygenase-like lactoylglutathione lyase family enzyme
MAKLGPAHPHLFVRNVPEAAEWFARALGFSVVFLYGEPPYFGEIARDAAVLNLRHVDISPFLPGRQDGEELLSAWIEVQGLADLHAQCVSAGADITVPPTRRPWGHTHFIVRDPSGNLICLSEPA